MKTLIFLGFLLLAATVSAQAATVTLTCTATGDDGLVGTASLYDLRYSQTAIGADTTAWFNAATQCTGEAVPLVAGTTQVIWSGDLLPATYYFLVRVADEVPNWGGWSNVAIKVVSDTQPPFRINDLR